MPHMTPAMARLERSVAQAREELKRYWGEVGLAAVAKALNLPLDPASEAPPQTYALDTAPERHISAHATGHTIAA
jgi:hypothetical protein